MEIENILELVDEEVKEYLFNYMEKHEATLTETIAIIIISYYLERRKNENNM